MRINYYQFPIKTEQDVLISEGCDPVWRFDAPGLKDVSESEAADACLAIGMSVDEMMDYLTNHKRIIRVSDTLEAVSVTRAKQLLRKHGGYAWTEHYDRSGCMFESTEIRNGKNNSRFSYNHHL